MVTLNINNQTVSCPSVDKKLMAFLRDDLRLTSVKDGCSEGACGSCMVLVDGKVTRACLPFVSSLADKKVLTVEGLSKREQSVFSYAFSASGAVQCGFCIPGMVISAKALIDANPSPTRHDVKKAIHVNICRCTGYVKIEDAILLAAEFFRENKEIPAHSFSGHIGENVFRLDADEKVLGTGIYTDDMVVPGMVYASALRTKYPRARVLRIDASEALAHSECIAVITAEDVPGDIKCGHLVKDWDALIAEGEITRYIGDSVAIAVALTKEALDTVLSLITVEYEVLEPMTSPALALADGAPLIHEDFSENVLSRQAISKGDADKAIAESAFVVTRHYSVPFTEHAFLEPECAIAMPDGDDGLMLYTGGQSIYDEQREISGLLGLPKEKIRVRSCLVGGGFGGKEDMSVQHHAALAAWIVKRPVKIKFSRKESMMVHPKRHAMEIDFTTACDENGKITAVKAKIVSDTGAYASLGGPVLQRACTHAGGPYNYQNIDVEGTAVITNNPPAGAFRGFGVPQSTFAMESNLNLLAEMVGISPWEIRFRNAIRPGQVLPNGQIADESSALSECLLAVKNAFERSPYTGIACGFKNSGLGVGVPDIGRCIISVESGKVHVRSSAACIGQGMATILMQMVCQTLDLPPELVVIEPPDTARTPNAGTTTASRQTLFSGEAAVIAAKQLLKDMQDKEDKGTVHLSYARQGDGSSVLCKRKKVSTDASKTEGLSPCLSTDSKTDEPSPCLAPCLSQLNGKEYYGEYKPHTDPMGSDKKNPVSHVAYGYAAQVVELEESGRLKKVTAAYDMGNVVNPKSAEGQIEGGIVMGLGYALTEDFPLDNGVPTAKFGTLGLFRATTSPEIETIIVKPEDRGTRQGDGSCVFETSVDNFILLHKTDEPSPCLTKTDEPSPCLSPAYGAKGVGELATIPTAPAAAGAYYRLDKIFRPKLPMEDTFYDK